jgi:universal stress protein A
MPTYNHILVAVDLTEESGTVLEKATEIGSLCQAKLSLVHVLEPLGYAYGGDIPMDLTEVQKQLDQHARERLTELGARANISTENLHVSIGRPETEVHRIAEETKADLIVVGSHGRHGFGLLLGSTANGVLHGAKCDVLAVRFRE